jgi:hypothetical protein
MVNSAGTGAKKCFEEKENQKQFFTNLTSVGGSRKQYSNIQNSTEVKSKISI